MSLFPNIDMFLFVDSLHSIQLFVEFVHIISQIRGEYIICEAYKVVLKVFSLIVLMYDGFSSLFLVLEPISR